MGQMKQQNTHITYKRVHVLLSNQVRIEAAHCFIFSSLSHDKALKQPVNVRLC